MAFISDDGGKTYNRCHCELCSAFAEILCVDPLPTSVWSNFEIGDLDFWRGEAYSKFVDFLDSKGGFYYEVSLRTSGFADPGMTLVIFILIAMG